MVIMDSESSQFLLLFRFDIESAQCAHGTHSRSAWHGSESHETCLHQLWDLRLLFGDTLWLCQNSYWKWPLIVDLPIKNGDFPSLHVSLPKGSQRWSKMVKDPDFLVKAFVLFWIDTSQCLPSPWMFSFFHVTSCFWFNPDWSFKQSQIHMELGKPLKKVQWLQW